MPSYHVTYFLQLPEMEGGAEKKDHGEFNASSGEQAIEDCLIANYPSSDWAYVRGCLRAVRKGKGTTAVLLRKQGNEIERLELELEQYKRLAGVQRDRILDLEAGLRTCLSASRNLLEKRNGD